MLFGITPTKTAPLMPTAVNAKPATPSRAIVTQPSEPAMPFRPPPPPPPVGKSVGPIVTMPPAPPPPKPSIFNQPVPAPKITTTTTGAPVPTPGVTPPFVPATEATVETVWDPSSMPGHVMPGDPAPGGGFVRPDSPPIYVGPSPVTLTHGVKLGIGLAVATALASVLGVLVVKRRRRSA